MKKTLAFLFIPLLTLAGCAKYDKPVSNDYYCQRIIHKLHTEAPRYRSSGANKRLAIEHAKLEKEYYHYNCELYQERKNAAKQSMYLEGGLGVN